MVRDKIKVRFGKLDELPKDLGPEDLVRLARFGTFDERVTAMYRDDMPVEGLIAIATDPDPGVRIQIMTKRPVPREVFVKAAAAYPEDCVHLSTHFDAPAGLKQSALLVETQEVWTFCDELGITDPVRSRLTGLWESGVRGKSRMTLGQALFVAQCQEAGRPDESA
jgi:hypothetical protein